MRNPAGFEDNVDNDDSSDDDGEVCEGFYVWASSAQQRDELHPEYQGMWVGLRGLLKS